MMDELFLETTENFEKCISAFQRDLSRLRTGRANLSILDGVRVEYYGSPTPIQQVASLNVSDPRLITIKPWDRSLISAIEKAIMAADVGITPNNDGNVIRLPIPPLTVERRRDLVKQVGKMAEAARVAIRGVRRDVKSLVDGDKEITEDDQRKALKDLQEMTDDFIKQVDKIGSDKEKEIMEQ
ncbi:MAG: ribosome recycling factor [Deltaproteobacteria bacterium]|nr:ribosome recycling factor [Deltaproteobacteria bacterium]